MTANQTDKITTTLDGISEDVPSPEELQRIMFELMEEQQSPEFLKEVEDFHREFSVISDETRNLRFNI